MTQASPILKSNRHAIHLTGDLREPAGPLHKYVFLVTHKSLNDRMQCYPRGECVMGAAAERR